METIGQPKRLPVFQQLADGTPIASRTLQVVSADPERVADCLQHYGPLEGIRLRQHSLTVKFSKKTAAARAYAELGQSFVVSYVREDVLGPAWDNSFHSHALSIGSSEASTLTSPRGQVDSQCSSQEEDEHSRLRKEPVDAATRLQYQVDLAAVATGQDQRTTVMIKNIPNKYTQKMLRQLIDECLADLYDFLYLPIDFKNRCNVGYAFINFKQAPQILLLAEHLEGKRWPRFNSDKVCELAYARIQGKENLIAHFQTSSVMFKNSAKVKPLIF